MPHIEHSVCPAYLLEPTPGMQCCLASSLEASLLLALVLAQFKFATKWLTRKASRNLATMSMILAARDLNEHGGKHRLLQTSSQPIHV